MNPRRRPVKGYKRKPKPLRYTQRYWTKYQVEHAKLRGAAIA